MGCGTALQAAVLAPERVAGLLLVVPPTAWETRRERVEIWEQVATLLEQRGVEAFIEGMRATVTPDPLVGQAEFDAAFEANARAADPVRLAGVFRGAGHADFPARVQVSTIRVPTADPGVVRRSGPSREHGRAAGRAVAAGRSVRGEDLGRLPDLDRPQPVVPALRVSGLDPPRRPRPVPGRGGGAAPTGAGRAAGDRGRRRRPQPAPAGGGHRLLRGAGVRRALGDAAAPGGPALPGRRLPPLRPARLRGRVGAGDGRPCGRSGWSWRCGAGTRRSSPIRRAARPRHEEPEETARRVQRRVLERDGAELRGGHRRDQAAGEDGDRVRQARRHRPADTRRVAADHGRPPGHGAVGHRRPHRGPPGRLRHPHGRRAGGGRPRRAGPPLRSDDRSLPQADRSGRRRRDGRRRAARRPWPQPGGDVRARSHRPRRPRRSASTAWPAR